MGDADPELRPAAKTAGGPNAGHEAAAGTTTSPHSPANRLGLGAAAGTGNGDGHHGGNGSAIQSALPLRIGSTLDPDAVAMLTELSEQFAAFQTDAPSCDNCGAITVRNGNCYLCHVCGTSMGCS
jgi:ribonucleoside-diphosphate reductase alpha chain